MFQGQYVKDLSALGRDLSKVAIIDNTLEAMVFQLHNAVFIESFLGATSDTSLLQMMSFLKIMDLTNDVRNAVSQLYHQEML